MGSGDPLDAVFLADPVEMAAGAAIGIANEDALEALIARPRNRRVDGRRDALGMVMEIGRQAGQRNVIKPVGAADIEDFAGDHAATDHANRFGHGFLFTVWHNSAP